MQISPSVRVRRLASPAELAALGALEKALLGSTWKLALKPRIQDVIEKDEFDELPDKEFNLYRSGHFDFVVYASSDGRAELAIELDGPSHRYPDQMERDVRKNYLCAEAGLPLLRFGGNALALAEQISLLGSLAERFVTWDREFHRLAPRAHRGRRHDAEAVELLATSLRESRLSANRTLALELHRLGMCAGREFGGHTPEPHFPWVLEPRWPGKRTLHYDGCAEHVVVELPVLVRSRENPSRVVPITGRGQFSSALHVGDDEYWDLPLAWLDPEWMALELALHDALTRVVGWAKGNAVTA